MNRGSLEIGCAFVALSVTAAVLFCPSRTLAAPLPVALDPTRFEFTAHPGEHLTGTLEFWNGSNAGLPVHVEAADFAPQDEEGHVTVGLAANLKEVNPERCKRTVRRSRSKDQDALPICRTIAG